MFSLPWPVWYDDFRTGRLCLACCAHHATLQAMQGMQQLHCLQQSPREISPVEDPFPVMVRPPINQHHPLVIPQKYRDCFRGISNFKQASQCRCLPTLALLLHGIHLCSCAATLMPRIVFKWPEALGCDGSGSSRTARGSQPRKIGPVLIYSQAVSRLRDVSAKGCHAQVRGLR